MKKYTEKKLDAVLLVLLHLTEAMQYQLGGAQKKVVKMQLVCAQMYIKAALGHPLGLKKEKKHVR